MNFAYLQTNCPVVNQAYYTAVSDVVANIKPVYGDPEGKPVLIAGIGYEAPWTRDTAINVSCAGYLIPGVAEDTLMAVLKKEEGRLVADAAYGQDWDSVIWVLGAWQQYLYNGDREFLKKIYSIGVDTWEYYEDRAYCPQNGLFRGPACYGDGIAAYPDRYVKNDGSGILDYVGEGKSGTDIEMYTLSTNCIYYQVLKTLDKMRAALGETQRYMVHAEALKKQITALFWNEEKGYYRYIIDDFGGCDSFEGMGNAFAILYEIADAAQVESIFKTAPKDVCGCPCVYPSFARYGVEDGSEYGRHSGTVWPLIQAFWATAAMQHGKYSQFEKEFDMLTGCAVRDGYFAEIYHPDTSLPYGGRQEDRGRGIVDWESEKKQTWSATGYLHMFFSCIAGMQFEENGIRFQPYLPEQIQELTVSKFEIRGCEMTIRVSGTGSNIVSMMVNGRESDGFVPYTEAKSLVEIKLKK